MIEGYISEAWAKSCPAQPCIASPCTIFKDYTLESVRPINIIYSYRIWKLLCMREFSLGMVSLHPTSALFFSFVSGITSILTNSNSSGIFMCFPSSALIASIMTRLPSVDDGNCGSHNPPDAWQVEPVTQRTGHAYSRASNGQHSSPYLFRNSPCYPLPLRYLYLSSMPKHLQD